MAKNVEYRDPEPNNFPDDYDRDKVDQRILKRSNSVFHKTQGVDVREGLGQAIEIAGVIAGEASDKVIENKKRQDELEKKQTQAVDRIDDAIAQAANKDEDLSETKDARTDSSGKTSTNLKKRLDEMEQSTNYQNQIELSDNIDSSIKESLINFGESLTEDTLNILLLTDLHYSERQDTGDTVYDPVAPLSINHVDAMELLRDKIDCTILNGDNTHGIETKEITLLRNKQILSQTKSALFGKPVLATVGNHDDNSVFKSDQQDRLVLSDLTKIYGKGYSYQDFENYKIRVIVLNGFENPEKIVNGINKYPRSTSSVFTQIQLEWLANKALKVPNGYSVIIFNHAPFLNYYSNKPYPNFTDVNHDALESILSAFINGSTAVLSGSNADYPLSLNVDFSQQGKGSLIGCVFGHEHYDGAPVIVNGITAIERTCNIAVGSDRHAGDISEYAFDVIQIDPTAKKVVFKRFGAGKDASFSYGGEK